MLFTIPQYFNKEKSVSLLTIDVEGGAGAGAGGHGALWNIGGGVMTSVFTDREEETIITAAACGQHLPAPGLRDRDHNKDSCPDPDA